MAICDKLANFEVKREQLLEEDTTKVDSTTKCNPPEKCRKVETQAKLQRLQQQKRPEREPGPFSHDLYSPCSPIQRTEGDCLALKGQQYFSSKI